MLSEVPEGWGESALQELCYRPISYGVLKPGDYAKDGRPMLRIQDVKTNFEPSLIWKISTELDEEYRRTRLNEGDIVFSVVGTLGEVKEIDSNLAGANISRAFAVIGADKDKICRSYLLQFLRGSQVSAWVAQTGRGGAQKVVNLGELRALPVPQPPLSEQHRIAEILSSVDDSIQATQAVIEQAERVKHGLMEELLTGGLGSEAIERGEVPEGWELCQLADKSIFTNGKAHEKDIDENGEFIVVNSKFISSEGSVAKRTNSAMCLAAKNDILMVMSDVPKGKAIAKCFYVDKGDFYTVNQRICRLTAQEIEPLFLFYVLNRNRYFLAFDDGVKQTNLRKNEVLECPVGVPPVDYQRKVIEILEAFTAKIDLDYKQLNRLKIIRRGLMDDLLTGKVRTV